MTDNSWPIKGIRQFSISGWLFSKSSYSNGNTVLRGNPGALIMGHQKDASGSTLPKSLLK